MRRIYPSLTTHSVGNFSWHDKLAEIEALKLSNFCLFVTGLNLAERDELYSKLTALSGKFKFTIPFVHAVSNMQESEYWFLQHNFGVEYFNLHSEREYPLAVELSKKIRSKILIENTDLGLSLKREDLSGFGGICCDVSHLEEAKYHAQKSYSEVVDLCCQNLVGANHISAVNCFACMSGQIDAGRSTHIAKSVSQFHYLSELPAVSFAELCAVELENPISEQLKYIPVIEHYISESERRTRKLAA